MSKRKTLDIGALASAAVPQQDPVQKAILPPPVAPLLSEVGKPASTRANKVAIQGYFPKEVHRRLKILAVEKDRSLDDLLSEAIADLLAKHRPDVMPS
ncbi:MAG: hypothetical protein QM756_16475 [Polyangiaceae bacterium]